MFQNSASGATGLSYMLGATGGYLVGYLLATVFLGAAARRGWDRSVPGMAGALLVGALVGTILDFVLDDDDGASEALQAALRGEGWRW